MKQTQTFYWSVSIASLYWYFDPGSLFCNSISKSLVLNTKTYVTWLLTVFGASNLLIRSSNKMSFSDMLLIWTTVANCSLFSLNPLTEFWFWSSSKRSRWVRLWLSSTCCDLKTLKSSLNWSSSFRYWTLLFRNY